MPNELRDGFEVIKGKMAYTRNVDAQVRPQIRLLEHRSNFFVDRIRSSRAIRQRANQRPHRRDPTKVLQSHLLLQPCANAQQQGKPHTIAVDPPRLFNHDLCGVVVTEAAVDHHLSCIELDENVALGARVEEKCICASDYVIGADDFAEFVPARPSTSRLQICRE